MTLNAFGAIVRDTWQWLGQQYEYVSLDQFVIMPDHFHAIIRINDICTGRSRTAPAVPVKSLGRLIGAFKTVSTKKFNQMQNTVGKQLWQRSFHDHIIRNDQSLNKIRQYIIDNPKIWENDNENNQ